jgi:Flp pilus assembly protein TadG
MKTRRDNRKRCARISRRGATAVEAVLVAPLLILILLGAIDIGQYVHVAQTVSNASRESARFASRHGTETVSSVREYTYEYLQNAFPRLSDKEIEDAVEVSVREPTLKQSIAEDLDPIESGDALAVTVQFDFQAVRWLRNIDYWNLNQRGVTTVVRRD